MVARITLRKPDDWHLHVRDGEMLKAALPHTAKHFGRAILMPKLISPMRTMTDCRAAGPDERAVVYRGGETIEWKVVSA